MKLVTYLAPVGGARLGVVAGEIVHDLAGLAEGFGLSLPATMLEFLVLGDDGMALARQVLARIAASGRWPGTPLSHVRLLAPVCPDITSTEDWTELYWMLDCCERDFEQMVFRFRLDPVLLFSIYRTLLVIKTRWLRYRAHDRTAGHGEEMHEEEDYSQADEEQWTPILSKFKDMIVASC